MRIPQGALLGVLLLAPPAASGSGPVPIVQEQKAPTATARAVAGPVHWIEGRGGNIGVSAGEDGVLIVDTQFESMAPSIRTALAGISEAPVKFVLNTHWHGDHTGGNAALARAAPIVAHENVRARMSTPGEKAAAPPAALPVLTYADAVKLHFNGEEIRVFHLPSGHTDGDSVVHFTGSNVAHLGDLFFVGRFPYVDLASGGSVRGMARNVGKLLELLPDGIQIIPGHGPLATKAELLEYHGMLVGVLAHVQEQLDAGLTLEDLVAGNALAEWEAWGQGFIGPDRFLDIVVSDLTGSDG